MKKEDGERGQATIRQKTKEELKKCARERDTPGRYSRSIASPANFEIIRR